MAQINIRLDDDVKKDADELFGKLGLNLSTAFNIFVRQSLRERRIPFEITDDPFYSAENMKALQRATRAADAGQLTPHELIED